MADMPSIDIEQRLAALETENASLRARLKEIEDHGIRKSAIPVPPVAERQVTITTPAPVSSFRMPTPAEMKQLLAAVGRYFPSLLSVDNAAFTGDEADRRDQYFRQFAASFEMVGNLKRTDRPDGRVYISFHVDVVERLLMSFGRPRMTIRTTPFLASCLAHFDIAVCGINRAHEGITPEVGLSECSGRPATDAWREIIAGKQPREVAVSRPAPSSPARVTYGF
jgi:hypothetical protein